MAKGRSLLARPVFIGVMVVGAAALILLRFIMFPGALGARMSASEPSGVLGMGFGCLLICYALPAGALLLFIVATVRAVRSLRRQVLKTRGALDPLLSLPAATLPSEASDTLHALGVEERTRIVKLDAPVALCHGLLRPRLLLSTGLFGRLTGEELEAVLHHERAHLRRRDPLRLLLVWVLADALPARRSVQELASKLPTTQELRADRAAITQTSQDALAVALLKVGDARVPHQAPSTSGRLAYAGALGTSSGASDSTLDLRMDQLLDEHPRLPSLPLVAVAWTLLALLASPFLCTGGVLASYVILVPSALWGLRRRFSS